MRMKSKESTEEKSKLNTIIKYHSPTNKSPMTEYNYLFKSCLPISSWNMARKLKIIKNEKHPLDDLKNDEITANVKNEKCTL